MPEFHCPDCPASFNTLYSLESHVSRLHAGDRPIERGFSPRSSRSNAYKRTR